MPKVPYGVKAGAFGLMSVRIQNMLPAKLRLAGSRQEQPNDRQCVFPGFPSYRATPPTNQSSTKHCHSPSQDQVVRTTNTRTTTLIFIAGSDPTHMKHNICIADLAVSRCIGLLSFAVASSTRPCLLERRRNGHQQ